MGTPFITRQFPTPLDGYDAAKPHEEQPAHIPKAFSDAMEVRKAVFVGEQGAPLAHEHDADDARSCHWVMYASVNQITSPERRDPRTGEVTRPRRSETRGTPVGTLRIVPFPHPPHPPPGARYVNDELQDPDPDYAQRQESVTSFGPDRPTQYHDGREPYVKLGRVAVVRDFREHHIGTQLWNEAKQWLEGNPIAFNPSVTAMGMDLLQASHPSDIPIWGGLVCCHAQERIVKVYEKWGFRVDESMGRWFEEGIPHVGMFQRLQVKEVYDLR
ncbi:acyl-CoA N-acyltransferase [Hypoxylon crocopeplum]|nr:acyl-CoA N-acyltransferase [Hypoxylon crocopeplum]